MKHPIGYFVSDFTKDVLYFIFSFISKEVLRSSDHFWVLISNKQVYFLSGYEPVQDNVMLKVPHNELSNCNILCRGNYIKIITDVIKFFIL